MVCDIGSGVRDVAPHLREDSLVVIAVEEAVLVVSLPSPLPGRCRVLVRLEASLLEYDDQPPRRVLLGVGLGCFRRGGDHGRVQGR